MNFDKVYDIIKKYNINMNESYKQFHNSDTLYHILSKSIRKNKLNDSDILNKFIKLQEPKLIYNDLILTYKDYLNYDIDFN